MLILLLHLRLSSRVPRPRGPFQTTPSLYQSILVNHGTPLVFEDRYQFWYVCTSFGEGLILTNVL